MSTTAVTVIREALRKNRNLLLWSLLLAAITQIFSLLDPILFQLIIDNYALKFDEYTQTEFVRGVGLLILGIIGVAFISRTAKTFKDYFVSVVTQNVGTILYAKSIEYTLTLPYAVFEDTRSGEVLQKIQKARDDVQVLIQTAVDFLFLPLIGAIFVITYSFFVHHYVGIAFSVLIPIIALVVYRISQNIKQAQRNIVRERGELAGSTTETLRNIELVKSLGLEDQEIGRLNLVNDQILELELKKVRIIRKLSFLQGTFVNAARSGVLLLMLWLIFNGAMSLGQLMTLFFYSFFVFGPLQSFGDVAANYQQARASIELLEEVYTMPPKEKPKKVVNIKSISEIKLENVEFQYQQTDNHALQGIDLKIQKGERVAFVGPSGSGKSTLIKLLLGLYDPNSGHLKINDIDSKKIDVEALRQKIGLVTQQTQLFAASVRENLLFVKPKAKDEELVKVLKQAQIYHIIERGSQGLETKIGEGGIKLSGGERQRLAIARALLREPDILVLDEATSSLDSETEQAITETIREISDTKKGLIVISIAHRLSTVVDSDRIYALKKGSIIEVGSHKQLLRKKGLYYSLWELQQASR